MVLLSRPSRGRLRGRPRRADSPCSWACWPSAFRAWTDLRAAGRETKQRDHRLAHFKEKRPSWVRARREVRTRRHDIRPAGVLTPLRRYPPRDRGRGPVLGPMSASRTALRVECTEHLLSAHGRPPATQSRREKPLASRRDIFLQGTRGKRTVLTSHKPVCPITWSFDFSVNSDERKCISGKGHPVYVGLFFFFFPERDIKVWRAFS